MDSWKRMAWGGSVIGLTVLIVAFSWLSVLMTSESDHTVQPAEPLIPTVVATSSDTSSDGFPDTPTETTEDRAHYEELAQRRFAIDPQPIPETGTTRWRSGVGVAELSPMAFDWPPHRPGWYLTWSTNLAKIGSPYESAQSPDMSPPEYEPLGMEFVPMVNMYQGELFTDNATMMALAEHNPGRVWLIGNEPDVAWQNNSTPEEYAVAYHQAYTVIKTADPTAQIAIGGVSQITPLRLAYLDRVRSAYEDEFGEPIPVDIWNMHAFVLREERDNWGVGIPPGFDDVDNGILWEIEDHDDLRLVENQIRLMRSWMARIGEGDKPLWITEYGILMPEEYGFPSETVATFMTDSFDLFDTLRDDETGDPDDSRRLIQRWAWFSTYYRLYPTGDLFDSDGKPTSLMESMSNYLEMNGD